MTPNEKVAARKAIADYTVRCEKNRAGIHYSQARPYTGLGVVPEHGFTADCSSYVTLACFWASDQTAAPVEDPNGRDYDHYGFTGTLLSENRAHTVQPDKYLVGDLALYGSSWSNTRHVVICRTKGTAQTAVWSSHGSEAGPLPVRLRYRGDLLTVVRPKSLL